MRLMAVRPSSPPGRAHSSDPELPLPDGYLADIHRVESLAQNQSGSDKTWVERMIREAREHLARAERIR
jgi:hypothetical protein